MRHLGLSLDQMAILLLSVSWDHRFNTIVVLELYLAKKVCKIESKKDETLRG